MSLTRRHTLGGLLGAGAALTLAACTSDDPSRTTNVDPNKLDGVLARVKDSGTIRIGMEGVYAPYGYHEGGKLVGIEKEIGDLVAQDLGVKATYVETKWDSLIAGIDVNKYDVIFNNIVPTEERKQKYDFSIPYARSIGKVAVLKGSGITAIDQVKGKRAAQTPSSNWGKQAAALGAEIVTVEGFVQAVELVNSGRADLTLNDFVSFQQFFKKTPNAKIELLKGDVEANIQICALFNKGNADFKAELDKVLGKRLADGSISAIMKKYTDTDFTPTK